MSEFPPIDVRSGRCARFALRSKHGGRTRDQGKERNMSPAAVIINFGFALGLALGAAMLLLL
ncbi:hypothetical protein [Paracoccus sulfuroxidans]|uniref:hypothetical protein n=1 Tax=Paracoccus sulfuroxidans TaxID=384678 RepID=UPI0011A5089D|nr:hypothetical protein [Paracoccus sulfuroxidans]